MLLDITTAGFDYYSWIGLPLLIFCSRLCDVTLNTLRHVLSTKGYKKIPPLLGFVEVLIWLIVIGQVMKNLNNAACYIAWAAGFATGNYLGLIIEEKLALGLQIVRIITNRDCNNLLVALKNANHGITVVDGEGAKGPVKLIYTIAKRENIRGITRIINEHTPGAFYSIEDIRNSKQGVFSGNSSRLSSIKNFISKRP